MEFQLKPDYDKTYQRFEAFWNREIIDRPPITITLYKPGASPRPIRRYASLEEKWLDIDGRIDEIEYGLESQEFLYDALPVAFPNLGPEIFSAWCGCGYGYGKTTTWSTPVIEDWERDYEKARRCILKSRALYDSSDVQMCRSLSYICECFLEHKTGRIRQSRSALEMAKQTYAVLGSPRDALYFFRAAAYLKRTSPEDYSDLLPEPWEYNRDNADRISDSFSALSSEIKI